MRVISDIGDFWIIMRTDGCFLPELSRKTHGGYTHTEPTKVGVPRLFTTQRGAKNALTWWLKGVTSQEWDNGNPMNGDAPEDFIGDPDPRPERKAEAMVIVPALLARIVEEVT